MSVGGYRGVTQGGPATTKGQRTIASLLAVGMVLLTGCTIGTWQAYPGKTLPNSQTALIRSGHGVLLEILDGSRAIPEQAVWVPVGSPWGGAISWARKSIRVLPGTHDVEVRKRSMPPTQHVIIDAEAGEIYTVHWDMVEEVDHIWVEDKSRSVVFGEKPPAE